MSAAKLLLNVRCTIPPKSNNDEKIVLLRIYIFLKYMELILYSIYLSPEWPKEFNSVFVFIIGIIIMIIYVNCWIKHINDEW